MKIRKGRPNRFVSVPNTTVDDEDHLDIVALGLLTQLLRLPPHWDTDVETIAKRRGPGRRMLTNAMSDLVTAGYVVKIKHQDHQGRWATEAFVFDEPATTDEVAALLEDFGASRAVRVEPHRFGHLANNRPTGSGVSVVTSENTPSDTRNSRSQPTDRFPTVGEPTVGTRSALSEDGSEDCSPDPEEPETISHTDTDPPSTAPDRADTGEPGQAYTPRQIMASLDADQLARIDTNTTQLAQLEADCTAALDRGVDPGVLAAYVPAKLAHARTVTYLRRAITEPRHLPTDATLASLGLTHQAPTGADTLPTTRAGTCPQHPDTLRRVTPDGAYACPTCYPEAWPTSDPTHVRRTLDGLRIKHGWHRLERQQDQQGVAA